MEPVEETFADTIKSFESARLLHLSTVLNSNPGNAAPTLLAENLAAVAELLKPSRPLQNYAVQAEEFSDETRQHVLSSHFRIVGSICENQGPWHDSGSPRSSLWMRFVSHSLRSLMPDATFISNLDYSYPREGGLETETTRSSAYLIVSRSIDSVELPVLCMAEDRSVIPMVYDALSRHRLASQYDLPVVGLLYPRSSTNRCHVILGWFSRPLSLTSQEQPIEVYFAIPDYQGTQGEQPSGVFDLSTRDGARSFTSFLVGCGIRIASANLKVSPHPQQVQELLASSGPPLSSEDDDRTQTWVREQGLDRQDIPPISQVYFDIVTPMEQHRGPVCITWKSEPNTILIEEGIWNRRPRSSDLVPIPGRDVEDEYPPGIMEWSLDHHVLTLPFVSRGNTYARYQGQLDAVRDLLKADSKLEMAVNAGYLTAENSGSDLPLRSESVEEALAILVHEMGLLCNDGGNSCWERSWHEISRCSLVMGHQCTAEQGRHVTFSELGHINFSRCAEYDRRVVDQRPVTRSDYSGEHGSSTPREVLPYAAIDDQLDSYRAILRSDTGRPLEVAAKHVPEFSPDEQEQIERAAEHAKHLRLTINGERAPFCAWASPGIDLSTRQGYIERTMAQFNSCIDRYPLEDVVDAAMTVAIEDFYHTLESHTLSVQDIKDHVLFFKCFKDDTADIQFHLPVLLVKHEEDGNKQHGYEGRYEEANDEEDNVEEDNVEEDNVEEDNVEEDNVEEDNDKEDSDEEYSDEEYSDEENDETSRNTTSNVQRMDCISAVHFLAAFGIKDFQIYGLTTYGSRSSLCQAWFSEADNCCYIVDQIPAKDCFNIAKKDGVMQYIAFLGKMKAHAEELRSRFESVRELVVEKLSTPEGRQSLQWTFHAQIKQYGLVL